MLYVVIYYSSIAITRDSNFNLICIRLGSVSLFLKQSNTKEQFIVKYYSCFIKMSEEITFFVSIFFLIVFLLCCIGCCACISYDEDQVNQNRTTNHVDQTTSTRKKFEISIKLNKVSKIKFFICSYS